MLHPWNTYKLQISFCRVGYYTRHSLYMPQWDLQIPHILSDLRVPHEGDGELCFYLKKYLQKLQVIGFKEGRGSVSSGSILQLPKALW
jgi:hypothetical protein